MKIFQKIEFGFLLFLISGCAITLGIKPQKGNTYHYVKKGETLFRISKYYYEGETVEEIKIGIEKIKKANDMKDENIYVGQKLIIPDTKKKQPDYALLPPETIFPPQVKEEIEKPTELVKTPIIKESKFIWPVDGKIICRFGELGNKGIDLMVEPGSQVISSADGEVVFVGDTRKYGETIILKHSSSTYTVYGHDIEIKVKNGDKIKQGQILAQVKSGTQRKRYIHFEIIIDGVNVDPLIYLPKTE